MKAILLIFNDRDNPKWFLDNDESNKLYEHLCSIPGTMVTWDRNDYLGYRGIEISLPDETMRIYKSIVEIVGKDEVRRFIDINRELEAWIFQTSRDRIEDDIYNQLLLSEFQ